MEDRIAQEKIERYLKTTSDAIKKARIIAPGSSYIGEIAADFMDMARRYHEDAKHFYQKGDLVNSFAAVNYAHGWLDAGARLGIFDVDEDSRLFTLAR